MTTVAVIDAPKQVPPAPPAVERPTKWGSAVVIGFTLISASAMATVLTPLQEAARLDFGFSDMQISLVQGGAKGLPIALLSIPLGLAIDHWNRARLLFLLGLLWTAGTIWTALATDFTTLFAARVITSMGIGGAIGVAISMFSDLSMPDKRGRLLLIGFFGTWIGIAIGFAVSGALFGRFGTAQTALFSGMAPWRQVVLAFGIGGAVLLLPVAFLPEPTRYEREQRDNAILPALRAVWLRRAFLIPLFLGQMAGGMAEGSASIWAAPVLQRNFGQSPAQFGGWMGAVTLIGGLLGSVLGGYIADKGTASKRRGGILIGAIAATILSTPAAAYPIMPNATWFGIALGVLLIGGTMAGIIGTTTVTVLIPNEERGLIMAVIGVVGTLVGMVTAPLVALVGLWVFGNDRHLPASLTIIGICTGAIAVVGYLVAMANAPERRTEIEATV